MVFQNNKTVLTKDLIPDSKEKITLGQLILAGAFIMLSFSSCTVAISNKNLSERRITNVQLADGTAILVQQQSREYREPKLIMEFTKQWASLMFGWEGVEEGISIGGEKKVPSNAYAASLSMASQFREDFLKQLAPMVSPSFFAQTNHLKSSILVRYVSEPIEVKGNVPTWKVNLVADWIVFDEWKKAQVKTKPFNKILTVAAAAIPNSPLGEKANDFEKLVNKMRASGLEITSIETYQ
jgi:hypothetical protein